MNNECAPKREAEVSNQIGQLERAIEEMGETIKSLRSRIAPILKPVPTTGCIETAKDPSELVLLATAIRQCRNKLSGYNQNIREMIETCEL